MEVDVPGARLHVDVDGPDDGPTVLFLHGALASGRAFRGQLPALVDRYRVLRPDQRGHGRSTHVVPTFAQLVDDALALMGPAPVHLVGASMGGMVAARVATIHPDRVLSLTLLSTPPASDAKWRAYFARTPPDELPPRVQALARLWHGEDWWRDLARGIFAQFADPDVEAFHGRPRPPRALVMHATSDELLDERDPERWVERIGAPTRVLRTPGDHAFFADGRDGTRAANHALRPFLDTS